MLHAQCSVGVTRLQVVYIFYTEDNHIIYNLGCTPFLGGIRRQYVIPSITSTMTMLTYTYCNRYVSLPRNRTTPCIPRRRGLIPVYVQHNCLVLVSQYCTATTRKCNMLFLVFFILLFVSCTCLYRKGVL